ncbi:putative RNA polymerase ECF subfamily sigma factor [Ilumatobacter coccineus YM16-304]|uniref:Putative RNA polymerase ECF subfamily sigma factor n=1 Tax=Ilumatobacter coccineus (strain NBRC 103263 / KCTC 29153 / YM16-304) TaxID=1313172 RepID=A0A6C7E685_ILUCY|nr:putative RNA polymerase ECF subfamily sigma factor [Ilumatobacter coccineus YM16-304]
MGGFGVWMMMAIVSERRRPDSSEALLVRSYPALRRYAAVAAPPEVAPDDLLHDAIVAVLRSGGFDGIEYPAAYVKRAMVNLASNERRRLGRRRSAIRALSADVSGHDDDSYPSDLAHLAELSAKERVVLFAHYVDGDSFETIAQDLDLRPSSVRQIATRARRALRRLNGDD